MVTGAGPDHDLLIRIDERVEEMQSSLTRTLDIIVEHGKRILVLEQRQCPTPPAGIVLSRPVAIAIAAIVLLALGGALTLDFPKAESIAHSIRSIKGG